MYYRQMMGAGLSRNCLQSPALKPNKAEGTCRLRLYAKGLSRIVYKLPCSLPVGDVVAKYCYHVNCQLAPTPFLILHNLLPHDACLHHH